MFELQTEKRSRGCATSVVVITTVAFFGIFALPYYVTALLFGGPIVYFNRHRVAWKAWEAYVLVIPPIVYVLGFLLGPDKGLLQPPAELLVLGLGVPLALAVRVAAGKKGDAWPLTVSLIAGLAFLALIAGALIPPHMAPD
jgi:hypothetical protein